MPMKLSEKEVLAMVQREWDRKVEAVKSKYGSYMGAEEEQDSEKSDEKKKDKKKSKDTKSSIDIVPRDVSSGTRIRHKNSGIEYTVVSVSPRDMVLKTPEGRPFTVDANEVEEEYELD